MNTQRKYCAAFLITFGLVTKQINAMEQSAHSASKEALILTTGCAIGIGCAGFYYWYSNHQKRLEKLEKKTKELKKSQQSLRNSIETIQFMQEQEVVRLNQTRTQVMDSKKKYYKKLKKLDRKIATMEAEHYYSLSDSERQITHITYLEDKKN